MSRYDFLESVLLDVYFRRIERWEELDSCYDREWAKGVMTYEHITELSQEVAEAFEHADGTLVHALRNSKEKDLNTEQLDEALKAIKSTPVLAPHRSRKSLRVRVPKHAPPNLSTHRSSNAPPRHLRTHKRTHYEAAQLIP